MAENTDDVRVRSIDVLTPPAQILEAFPLTPKARHVVAESRRAIHHVLHGLDDRLIVIIGPCSIHEVNAAREYGARLVNFARGAANDLVILMRVYFEKPRTTVGWKGLINDPGLDGTFRINDGLRLARGLLRDLNEAGLPVACEFLDMVTPQYIADLVSWGAIGARTTESQIHRELASGLSCPVGFKNGTDGNIRIACDAIKAASRPHHFLSVTKAGHSAIVATTGNED
ncbi:MAG TPA: 3-deoxy-7-phosphoheptulonate synthase, partial [Burkholderiales bacterium]|nr:3-deoxy-7-phosphoheptulonate synthase [Burkholderiales bacterium]